MMLREIVDDLAFEGSLLVVDSCSNPGYPLLLSLINSLQAKCTPYTVLDFEHRKQSMPTGIVDSTVSVDVSADAWNLVSHAPSKSDCVLIIPSLSLYVLSGSLNAVSTLVRLVKARSVKLITVVHSDVLPDEDMLPKLEYLYNTVCTLQPLADRSVASLDGNGSYHGHVKTVRLKPSGKIDTSDEYYTMHNDYSLDDVHASASAVIKSAIDSSSATSGAGGLSKMTFNLSLSDKERDAKNKLQLPYIKRDEDKIALLSGARPGDSLVKIHPKTGSDGAVTSGGGGGKIYYHYDEADDFDEEDPDDDLDI